MGSTVGKEAGEPVTPLLAQEKITQAREVPNGGPPHRLFNPRRGTNREKVHGREVLEEGLIETQ